MSNPVRTGSKVKFYLFVISMLAISFIHFMIFWVYINFDTIRLTLYRWSVTQEYVFCGFYNYSEIIKYTFIEPLTSNVNQFWNTFRAIIINLIILPIAVITSYAFYKKVYGEKVFRIIFYLPSIISIVVQCSAFIAMFKTYTIAGADIRGPYASFFSLFGYSPNWLSTGVDGDLMWPLIYAFCIIAGLGTNVILMSSAMIRIPDSITEAAEMDGCGFYKELFSISLPLIMPTITTWLTALLTSVFGFLMQPMLLTGEDPGVDGRYLTIPWVIFAQVQDGAVMKNIPSAATLGIVLSVIVMPIVTLMRWLCNKFTPDVSF